MPRFFACLLLLSGLALCVSVDKPATAAIGRRVDSKEVERLIQLLSDPRFPIRTTALAGLEKMGPPILPHLRAALTKAADPEIKRQLEALIPQLERQVALQPTRITLDLKDATLTKAAAELSKQSGYKVEIYRHGGMDPDQQLVTMRLKNATFWEAIGKLCEAGGYTLQEHYSHEGRTIRLMSGDHYPGSLYLSGAFRIMVRNISHYRRLDFSNGRSGGMADVQRSSSLSIHLSICAEPKMPLLGAGMPTITEAVDDQGQSVRKAPQGRYPQHYHGYRSYMHNVEAQLETSPNGRRLRTFKGTIPLTVVSSQRPLITIDALQSVKNKTYKQGTTTIHVESVSESAGQTHIKMNISESSRAGTHDYAWSQTVLQRLDVLDDKGNKLQSYGGNWNGGVNTLQGTFTFGGNGNNGKGVKLVLHEWATVTHNVPFEFEDIPLP